MNRTRRSLGHVVKALGALGLIAALGAAPGCMVSARGRVASSGYVAYEQPPAPRQETYQPRGGHVWVKGHWEWQRGQWQWVAGHWERERAGYLYQDGRWEQRNSQWHWIEGQWTVSGQGYGNTYVDDRDQVRDHRDGQPGTYQPGYGPPPPSGGTVVVPPGGLTASNSAGTVITGSGGVIIVGPNTAPPAVRYENPGAGRGGHVWIRGYWQWSNGQYEWVPGHWEREKAGHRWYDGEWRNQGGSWVWVQGEWRSSVQAPPVNTRDRRTH